MRHVHGVWALVLASAWGCSSVGDAVLDVQEPLSQPESVLHEPKADVYLVSNVAGAPAERNNHGFIARLHPEGKVLAARFIAGGQADVVLHAPKGMAIVDGVLFVADIDHVRLFDVDTGAKISFVAVEGAEFLNDVVALPDGSVLVSDTAKNRIVRVTRAGEVSTFLEEPRLGGANGLALSQEALWVMGYADGTLSKVSLSGKLLEQHKLDSELDGAVAHGQGVIVSSWAKKAVLRVNARGDSEVLWRGLESPADIGFDPKRKRVLVPMMMKNRLLGFALKQEN